jgi:hypothetical protein
MTDIIDLNSKRKQVTDPKVVELYTLGITIDELILEYVDKGFDLFEVSAVLSHRLGECISNIHDRKEEKVDTIIDIILKKAGLYDE